jgi:hypothetical protein
VSRDPADDNQHLPPWLRGLPLPPRPANMSAVPADQPRVPPGPAPEALVPAEPTQDIPDWLRELGDVANEPSLVPEPLPSWSDERSELSAPLPQDEQLPDWLRDLRADTTPPNEEPAPLPDWLRGSPSEIQQPALPEAAVPQESDLPEWLRGAQHTPETPESAGEESLPAWLADLVPDEPPAIPVEAPEANLSPPSAPSDPVDLRDLDTLSDIFAETGPSNQPEDAGLPAWLRDIPSDEIRRVMEGDEEGITAEPFTFDQLPEQASAAPSADVSSWLSGVSEATGDDTDSGPAWLSGLTDMPKTPSGTVDADLPLWLQDADAGTGEAVPTDPAAPFPSQAESQPAWLDASASAQAPLDISPTRPQADSLGVGSGEGLPPWLQADTPSSASEELPSWLQTDTPASAEQERQASAGAGEELPSWLQADTPASAAGAGEELPSWLQSDLAPSFEAPAAPAEADVPDWLRADVTPPPAPSERQELPPWLSDAIVSTPNPEPAHTPPPEISWRSEPAASPEEELPAWLRDDAPAPQAEEAPPWLQADVPPAPFRSDTPTPPLEDLPPWLRDDTGQPLPTAGRPGDANLPEWLRGEEAYGTDSSASAQSSEADLSGQTPTAPSLDWFEEDTSPSIPGQAPAAESEFFGGAELPAWLRKTDADSATEISAADARSVDWLTKLGSHEEESVIPAVAPAIRTVPLPQAPSRSPAQVQALALLQRLAADPYPVAVPTSEPASASVWQRIGLERLLYVVLLIALLAALTVPDLSVGLQSTPQAPGAAELFQRIDTLTSQDVVLIGYEWDARRISELKPLEQAVIGQLIQKQVKLVLVSTDPQGSLLLFDLRDELQRAGYKEGGEDYILLGYKPGGDLALRALAQDFQAALRSDFQNSDATISALAGGSQTGKPLVALSDFSMLLVLADQASDVQSWVEQIRRSVPQTPLAFLLPAESVPLVEPYLQPPRDARFTQIYHLAGKQGALAYEHLRGAQHTLGLQIEREIGQFRLSLLVFVALLLIGGMLVGISGALRRGRS